MKFLVQAESLRVKMIYIYFISNLQLLSGEPPPYLLSEFPHRGKLESYI